MCMRRELGGAVRRWAPSGCRPHARRPQVARGSKEVDALADALAINCSNPAIVLNQVGPRRWLLSWLGVRLMRALGPGAGGRWAARAAARRRRHAKPPSPSVQPPPPVCSVLAQELAKTFAGKSSEKDKYKAFMEATQFDQ